MTPASANSAEGSVPTMSWAKFVREFSESGKISDSAYERIRNVVFSTIRRYPGRYPPEKYSNEPALQRDKVGQQSSRWSDEQLEALTHDVIVTLLDNRSHQYAFVMANARSFDAYDKLIVGVMRRTLRRLRRRSLVDNVVDRVRTSLIESADFNELSKGVFVLRSEESTFATSERVERSDPRLQRAAQRARLVPRENSSAIDRAPRVYSTECLAELITIVASAFDGVVDLTHIRMILEEVVTDASASDLLLEQEEEGGTQGIRFGSDGSRSNTRIDDLGPAMARTALSPSDQALVALEAERVADKLTQEEVVILKMKFRDASDSKLATLMGVSRKTAHKKKTALMGKLNMELSGIESRLHLELVERLRDALGTEIEWESLS